MLVSVGRGRRAGRAMSGTSLRQSGGAERDAGEHTRGALTFWGICTRSKKHFFAVPFWSWSRAEPSFRSRPTCVAEWHPPGNLQVFMRGLPGRGDRPGSSDVRLSGTGRKRTRLL